MTEKEGKSLFFSLIEMHDMFLSPSIWQFDGKSIFQIMRGEKIQIGTRTIVQHNKYHLGTTWDSHFRIFEKQTFFLIVGSNFWINDTIPYVCCIT